MPKYPNKESNLVLMVKSQLLHQKSFGGLILNIGVGAPEGVRFLVFAVTGRYSNQLELQEHYLEHTRPPLIRLPFFVLFSAP